MSETLTEGRIDGFSTARGILVVLPSYVTPSISTVWNLSSASAPRHTWDQIKSNHITYGWYRGSEKASEMFVWKPSQSSNGIVTDTQLYLLGWQRKRK